MSRKELWNYIQETFQFNIQKEKVMYLHLCKEKMKKKQLKGLLDKEKFSTYASWKHHIVDTYGRYDYDGLIEFDKMLNLLTRDSEKFDVYNKCIWTAYISTIISVFMSETVRIVEMSKMTIVIWIFLAPLFIGVAIAKGYDSYGSEGKTIYFLKDVQEVIHELIEEKKLEKN